MIAITTKSSMSVNPEVRFLLIGDMHDSTFVKAGFQGEKYSLTLTAIENNKNQTHASNNQSPPSYHNRSKGLNL
jgi:hypothetical protein